MVTRIQVPPVLDSAAVHGLHAAIDAAGQRVLLLEGAEGVFCRGMDLAGLADDADPAASARAFARCLEALRFSPCPTIALVDGAALGGGLGLAASCDVVLATPRATFGLPELLFGLLPAIVLPVVLERVSSQRLRLLALRGHAVTADQAHALGLVDEVIPPDGLAKASSRWARTLLRADPRAVALLKQDAAPNLTAGLERGASLTAERLHDAAVLALARDFADGGAPWLT